MKINVEENEVKMKVLGTYVNVETYDKLKTEAENNFMSLSSLIKKIIYTYLKNKEN